MQIQSTAKKDHEAFKIKPAGYEIQELEADAELRISRPEEGDGRIDELVFCGEGFLFEVRSSLLLSQDRASENGRASIGRLYSLTEAGDLKIETTEAPAPPVILVCKK